VTVRWLTSGSIEGGYTCSSRFGICAQKSLYFGNSMMESEGNSGPRILKTNCLIYPQEYFGFYVLLISSGIKSIMNTTEYYILHDFMPTLYSFNFLSF